MKIPVLNANGVGPNQTSCSAVSDLGLCSFYCPFCGTGINGLSSSKCKKIITNIDSHILAEIRKKVASD